MAYNKKELTSMSYAEVKAAAQALNVMISREGGGGRKSKVELVDDILEAQEGNEGDAFDEEEELELDDMSRKELKVLAKELGLKVGGTKAALVDRISDYYDAEEDDDEEDEDWDEDDEETIELTLDDLDDMTVKELRGLAEELGVESIPRRKAQIIDAIVDAAGEDEEEDDDEWEDEEEDDDVVDYESLTRKELKALCAARSLPKGGAKAKLIARLEAADEEVDEPEDEPEEAEEEAVAAVTGPTGPLETAAADMTIGSSFLLTRQSADKWTLTPTAGAFVPATGVVSTAPVHDEFSSMSRAELKDELRERGLKVGGRKAEQLERLRAFSVETAGTNVTRKYKGRAWKNEVYSDEYKTYVEKSRAKSYSQFVKFARKKGAKWEKHADERIDRIRASMALQEVLGVEKYKPEYQDQAARQAIKG